MLDVFPLSQPHFFSSFQNFDLHQAITASNNKFKARFLHVVNWIGPEVTDKTSWSCKFSKLSVFQRIAI